MRVYQGDTANAGATGFISDDTSRFFPL